jgi:hypothetical protein
MIQREVYISTVFKGYKDRLVVYAVYEIVEKVDNIDKNSESLENTLRKTIEREFSRVEIIQIFISFHKMERATSKIIVIKDDLSPILS